MKCEYPNCPNTATQQMYIDFGDTSKGKKSKSKPFWKVCPEHDCTTIEEILDLDADSRMQKLTKNHQNKGKDKDAKVKHTTTMTITL